MIKPDFGLVLYWEYDLPGAIEIISNLSIMFREKLLILFDSLLVYFLIKTETNSFSSKPVIHPKPFFNHI